MKKIHQKIQRIPRLLKLWITVLLATGVSALAGCGSKSQDAGSASAKGERAASERLPASAKQGPSPKVPLKLDSWHTIDQVLVQDGLSASSFSEFIEQANRFVRVWNETDRSSLSGAEYRDLVLRSSFYRERFMERLMLDWNRLARDEQKKARKAMTAMGLTWTREQRTKLGLLPPLELPIIWENSKASGVPFSRWAHYPEFTSYPYLKGDLYFRGIRFQAGDVLVLSIAHSSDGLFASIGDRPGFASHVGYFVYLNSNGKSIPAVLEIYDHGLRAIPLRTLLSSEFTKYVEVYRLKDQPPQWPQKLTQAAQEMLTEVKGYSFLPESIQSGYLTCTQVGELLFKKTGATPIEAKTVVSPQIQKNLSRLGGKISRFLSPMDYVFDPSMHFVGTVDNQKFSGLLAKELFFDQFHFQLVHKKLNLEHSSFWFRQWYHVNRWAAYQGQKNTWLGRRLIGGFGFDTTSLPRGPANLMAIANSSESKLENSIFTLEKSLHPLLAQQSPMAFNFEEFQREVYRRKLLNKPFKPFALWFETSSASK